MTTILRRRSTAARAWILSLGSLAAVALAIAGCGGGSSTGSQASGYGAATGSGAASSAPSSSTAGASSAASVALANTKLGKVLVDSKGQTLYLWRADTGGMSTCTGACAQVWPPLTTTGKPVAGDGVLASKLGTTKRSDGTTEVTYSGHPLYTFVGDKAPGQTTGEGNKGFGAEWDVLTAAGNKIGDEG
jgi:predicted lipoprotein with Yx(FWY)xxD motif